MTSMFSKEAVTLLVRALPPPVLSLSLSISLGGGLWLELQVGGEGGKEGSEGNEGEEEIKGESTLPLTNIFCTYTILYEITDIHLLHI